MADDYLLLGLGELTSLVTGVRVSAWGSVLTVECVYAPGDRNLPYQLIFEDCQAIQWDVLEAQSVGDVEADLIGISLGKEEHQAPAIIHTDIFEVSVTYGSFRLERAASQMPQGSPENAQSHRRSHPTLIS
jgi:hypothetical protein